MEKIKKEILDYKHALDEAVIVSMTDRNGIINHVNDNFCKISKYKREELIGQNQHLLFAGYQTNEFIQDIWETITKGKVWKGELKNKAKDGSSYWLYTTIVPFLNEEGIPFQYLTIMADISDRKNAEESLKLLNKKLEIKVEERTREIMRKELQLRQTLDGMIEGVQLVGFDWKYLYVNDAFTKHAKYKEDELIGYTVMEKYPGIEETEVYKVYEKCFKERIPIKLENEFTFPDGSVGWFDLRFEPVPEGILILSVDITEEKKAEMKIKYYITKLEEMLFMTSHKVRQPVVSILGLANILESQMDNPGELKIIVNFMKQSAQNLDDFTRELNVFISNAKINTEK